MKKIALILAMLMILTACSDINPDESESSSMASEENKSVSCDIIIQNPDWSLAVTDDDKLFSPIPESDEEKLVWDLFYPFWYINEDFQDFANSSENGDKNILMLIEVSFHFAEQNGIFGENIENYVCSIDSLDWQKIPYEIFCEYFKLYFPAVENLGERIKNSPYYNPDTDTVDRPIDTLSYYTFSAMGGTFISSVEEKNGILTIIGCTVDPTTIDAPALTKEDVFNNADYIERTLTAELHENYWTYIDFSVTEVNSAAEP